MKTVYYFIVFMLFTIIVFSIFVIVRLLTLPFDPKGIVSQGYSRFWSKGIYFLCPWWKVNIEGLENIDKHKSYIVVANHQSMLDIPLMFYLPLNFRWVSKEEVFRIPVFGWVLWLRNDIAINRGGASSAKRMMDKSARLLKEGISINIFPEGTRSKTGKMGEFKQGSFLLAKKCKAEILPVVMCGTHNTLNDGVDGGFKIKAPNRLTLRVLKPVPVSVVKELKFDELSDKLHEIIETEHRAMAPEYYK